VHVIIIILCYKKQSPQRNEKEAVRKKRKAAKFERRHVAEAGEAHARKNKL